MLTSILIGVCYLFAGILLAIATGMMIALVLLPFITIVEKLYLIVRGK